LTNLSSAVKFSQALPFSPIVSEPA
jgi:hypothetical protein